MEFSFVLFVLFVLFRGHHDQILTSLLAYLEDDADAKGWLQSDQPRTGAKLASEDVWQWK